MTSVQPYLTAAEAAARLTAAGVPVSEDTVRRWGRSGRLACVKLPLGRLRFRPEDLDALATPTTGAA
jgi:predicted site-specific integrase-resolvase